MMKVNDYLIELLIEKERLVQTYIVVSGLLVSYYPKLSTPNLNAFFAFLVTVITYYVELSRKRLPDILAPNVRTNEFKLVYLNMLGIFSAVTFAYLVVDFVKHVYSDSSFYFWGEFLFLTIIVAGSLWLNFPEFTPRKTENMEK